MPRDTSNNNNNNNNSFIQLGKVGYMDRTKPLDSVKNQILKRALGAKADIFKTIIVKELQFHITIFSVIVADIYIL